uniref:Doublecortin domain-containing protein n=1 Tax=Ascaris lumbricoides TaxID=6252 RepID=A0A9J2PEE6_ASCLU
MVDTVGAGIRLSREAKTHKKDNRNHNASSGESKAITSSTTMRQETKAPSNLLGKRIRVYRNGDIFFKGLKAFLDVINERIGLTYGAKRLYTLSGQLVKTMDEIENDKEYVAATNVFTPLNYGQVRAPTSSSDATKVNSEVTSNRQEDGSSTIGTKKKLVKHKAAPKLAAPKSENQPKETTPNSDPPVHDNRPKKRKKVVKKKVKIPNEPSKSISPPPNSSSPASTITRAQSIIEHIAINERTPTPLPVRKEPDSEDENLKSDSLLSSADASPKEPGVPLESHDELDKEYEEQPSQQKPQPKENQPSGDEEHHCVEGHKENEANEKNNAQKDDEIKEGNLQVKDKQGFGGKVESEACLQIMTATVGDGWDYSIDDPTNKWTVVSYPAVFYHL